MNVWRNGGYGPTLYIRKHATWPATHEDLTCTAQVMTYMRDYDFEDMYDKAYCRACELDSPNSPDFESLVDSILDELEEIA